MRIDKVSMFRHTYAREAMIQAINEHYNKKHSTKLKKCLVVTGFLGTSMYEIDNGVTAPYMVTTRLLVTELHHGYVRVDIFDEPNQLGE